MLVLNTKATFGVERVRGIQLHCPLIRFIGIWIIGRGLCMGAYATNHAC